MAELSDLRRSGRFAEGHSIGRINESMPWTLDATGDDAKIRR
jgi:hypothetical protein